MKIVRQIAAFCLSVAVMIALLATGIVMFKDPKIMLTDNDIANAAIISSQVSCLLLLVMVILHSAKEA